MRMCNLMANIPLQEISHYFLAGFSMRKLTLNIFLRWIQVKFGFSLWSFLDLWREAAFPLTSSPMAVSCRVFKQLHSGRGRCTWLWTSRIWSPVKSWPMQLESRRWGCNEGRWRNWDSWRNHFPNMSWSVRHIVEGRNSVGTSLHTADDPLLLQRKKSIHMLPPWVSLVLLAFGFFGYIARRDAKVYSPLYKVVCVTLLLQYKAPFMPTVSLPLDTNHRF